MADDKNKFQTRNWNWTLNNAIDDNLFSKKEWDNQINYRMYAVTFFLSDALSFGWIM